MAKAKSKSKTKPIKAKSKSKSKPRHARRAEQPAPTPMAFGLSRALKAVIERLGGTVTVSDTVNRMMVYQSGRPPFTVDLKSGDITELQHDAQPEPPHPQPGHDTSSFAKPADDRTLDEADQREPPPEAAT